MRPEDLVSCITTDGHVALFQKLFGSETSIRLLGDRTVGHKRQWVSEDLGL